METNNHNQTNLIPASILIAAAIIGGAILLRSDDGAGNAAASRKAERAAAPPTSATKEIVLPIHWGTLGQKMVSVGALNREKFLALYAGEERELARRLVDEEADIFTVSKDNSGVALNLLWGVGIGNKSAILEKGEMVNPRYGGAERFAGTAGWTIADGDPMNHYSRHPFVVLTAEQEDLVARVARNIYRPCCDNPAHFPDCNHGMAMLGLLELMAAEDASEKEMYAAGLAINRLWFPAQYGAIDRYAAEKEIADSDAKTLLSIAFSSASGFQRVVKELKTLPVQRESGGGGGCSV